MNCYYCQHPLTLLSEYRKHCQECLTMHYLAHMDDELVLSITDFTILQNNIDYRIITYQRSEIYACNFKCRILSDGKEIAIFSNDPKITPSNVKEKIKLILTFQ
jgi:hypothetical protein